MNVAIARQLIAAAVLVLTSSAGAQPAARPLGLGFYAPELAVDPYQRFAYVQGLARHLSSKLGRPVRGRAYKRQERLQQDIRNKQLDLVVLGGLYVAANRSSGRVVATGKLSSPGAGRWSLMVKRTSSLAALRGKTLQLPRVGRIIFGLVENGLLGGNLKLRRYFRIVLSPDQVSAVQAVRIGTADVVFAPVVTPGLKPLLERSLVVPPPALVAVGTRPGRGPVPQGTLTSRGPGKQGTALPEPLVRQVRQAMASWRSSLGALVGWGVPAPAAYQRLAAAAQRGQARMVLVPPRLIRPRVRALINQDAVKYEYPDLDQLFVIP